MGKMGYLMKFGDEQSNLMDQFERLSFEVQLNQAILGRSLSEPSVTRSHFTPPQQKQQSLVPKGRRGSSSSSSGLQRAVKKLVNSIMGHKGGAEKEIPDPKNPRFIKAFSRSLRL